MFTAPFNGPATSFNMNQDSLNLYNVLLTLFPGINNPPQISDPDDVQVELPQVTDSLQVLLPNFTCVFENQEVTLPLTSYQLPTVSDNYIVLTSSGKGHTADLNPAMYHIPNSGPYKGLFGPLVNSLNTNLVQSTVPIALVEGDQLVQTWVVNVSGASSSFLGPNMLDSQGNGFAMLVSSSQAVLYYMANYNIQYQAGLISPSLLKNGNNSVSMGITNLGAGESLFTSNILVHCYVNSTITPCITYNSFNTLMNPFQVFPGYYFQYNVSTVSYINSWNWQYESGNYPTVWGIKSVALGSPAPQLLNLMPMFICNTGTSSILSVINISEPINLFTQISYIRDSINQIIEAYA